MAERLPDSRFLRRATVLLLLCLGCLIQSGAAATCGYGPFSCPASYLPASPATPCTTCGTSECCKVGFEFTSVTLSPNFTPLRWQHCMVTVNSMLLVIAGLSNNSYAARTGYLNDAWATSTGSSWVQRTAGAPFAVRAYHRCIAVGSIVYMLGGWNGGGDLPDVWSTADTGLTFTQITAAAPFGPRDSFGLVLFLNALWVIAGYSNGAYLNDIWSSSTNAASWAQVTPVGTIFSGRVAFGMTVFSNQIWMVGGQTGTAVLNEVWTSSNGAKWTNMPQQAPIQPRSNTVLVAYNLVMVLAGGDAEIFTTNPTVSYADVWASYDGSTWTKTTPLPAPLMGLAVSALGHTGYVTGGSTGAALSAAEYATVGSTTCGSTSFVCPIVYAPLSPRTLCSGTTCAQADCCSGSLGSSSGKYLVIVLAVPVSTYTPATLVLKIATVTPVPAVAIVVTHLAYSSLTVYLAVVGSTPALADAALALIAQAALSGLLGPVVTVFFADTPVPTPALTYPPAYPTIPIFRPPSTSNPALLALLTLLVIPLAICLGLICSYARRSRCMVPVPVCCAPPAMGPYYGAPC